MRPFDQRLRAIFALPVATNDPRIVARQAAVVASGIVAPGTVRESITLHPTVRRACR